MQLSIFNNLGTTFGITLLSNLYPLTDAGLTFFEDILNAELQHVELEGYKL